MVYSCGYWDNVSNLDKAQEAKMELVCRKLKLEPGMSVLDIGCGWGEMARYASEHYGVEVTGITVSAAQVNYAVKLCRGLPVEILLCDYRQINGRYDRIVSLGMFEHVGYKNYRTFMNVVRKSLNDGGLFLLHTIGSNQTRYDCDKWISKYIFPNSMIPSAQQICESAEGLFVLEDWHNFGADYDKTLMSWFRNFTENWSEIERNYGQRFYRMWSYYLLACAGTFRARRNQLWQIVYSPKGVPSGFKALRYENVLKNYHTGRNEKITV